MGAATLCFSATEAINNGQASVMQELVGKSHSVPRKEKVISDQYNAEKCFARVHGESESDANLQQNILIEEGWGSQLQYERANDQ